MSLTRMPDEGRRRHTARVCGSIAKAESHKHSAIANLEMPLFRRGRPKPATLTAIFVAASAGAAMRAVDSIEAVADAGLRGDRYQTHTGFWQATDACQVTLITTDDLDRAEQGQPAEIRDKLRRGQHRRNLVIDGLTAKQMHGRQLRIGTAVFFCDKPRPPCGYLDKIEGRGLCRALGRHSGACLRVVKSGKCAVGDGVEVLS